MGRSFWSVAHRGSRRGRSGSFHGAFFFLFRIGMQILFARHTQLERPVSCVLGHIFKAGVRILSDICWGEKQGITTVATTHERGWL